MSYRRPFWRRAAGPGLLPVLLVLISQLILPPGVMPSAAGPGLPIVLCTGHGPVGVVPTAPADGRHDHGDHDDGGSQHACAFAHHGLTSTVPPSPIIGVVAARYDLAQPPLPAAVSPGLGLAAPPPPSHAPPALLDV